MTTNRLLNRLIYPIGLALLLMLLPALPALAQGPVTNTNDSGAGSLRQAIADATAGNTITFDASIADGTITLSSELSIDKELTIDGDSNNITVSGNDSVRVFNIGASGVVTLSHLSVISGSNTDGGGIYIANGGTATVQNSTLSGNSAGKGGGIYNDGTLTVQNSTLAGNSSSGFGGGGIINLGAATVQNSTFSGNSAFLIGGGIFNNTGTMTVQNSTFSGNSAATGLGGGISNNSTTMTVQNTIIANSASGGDCNNSGTFVTNDTNLIEDGTCSPAFSGDPNLGPLADNGGDTLTFALLDGSTAINAGNDTTCLPTDQRGIIRPQGDQCDIGAYEAELGTPPTLIGHSPITNTVAAPLDSSVVLTYSAEISVATVTSQTVAVHSMMRGLVTGTHSVNGNVVTVNPATDFFPGELVYAIATTRTTDITGTKASATQWQFTAGSIRDRCAEFTDVSATAALTGVRSGSAVWGDYDNDGDLDILLTG